MTLPSKYRHAARAVFAGPRTLDATEAAQVANWFHEAANQIEALQAWLAARVSAREVSDAEYLLLISALRGLFNEIKRLDLGHEGSELLEVMCDARRALDRCEVSRHSPDGLAGNRAQVIVGDEYSDVPPAVL